MLSILLIVLTILMLVILVGVVNQSRNIVIVDKHLGQILKELDSINTRYKTILDKISIVNEHINSVDDTANKLLDNYATIRTNVATMKEVQSDLADKTNKIQFSVNSLAKQKQANTKLKTAIKKDSKNNKPVVETAENKSENTNK